jgi:hypothetical protein
MRQGTDLAVHAATRVAVREGLTYGFAHASERQLALIFVK